MKTKTTIHATVNKRLLRKAGRLFTGTIEGRIIEVLQNARRAGATCVSITNKNGVTVVTDNGRGIDDFQKLLDMGGSGWDERMEAGEDPAGVGLFSLSMMELAIESNGNKVVIGADGWTGADVEVRPAKSNIKGTTLSFSDSMPWEHKLVEPYAVFTGMDVIVDGCKCASFPFCSDKAAEYDGGYRIEVLDIAACGQEYRASVLSHSEYSGGTLVNFHGQVVCLNYKPTHLCELMLVDICDQTDLRLMLPARTQLIENDALNQFKRDIEKEFYLHIQKQPHHKLYYSEYLRAMELGVELKESEPVYTVGLDEVGDTLPVDIMVPEKFDIRNGYLMPENKLDRVNAHLLAATNEFPECLNKVGVKPFIPVTISDDYIGYSWTDLPSIKSVKLTKGKLRQKDDVAYRGTVECYERLTLTAETSDGKTYRSDVVLAVSEDKAKEQHAWCPDNIVCVTQDTLTRVSAENILYHLGGYTDNTDSWDTQLDDFTDELEKFFDQLVGPYESLRSQLFNIVNRGQLQDKWKQVKIIHEDSSAEITFLDGRKEHVSAKK